MIVIDLQLKSCVRVDPEPRRATIGGGAVRANDDHETRANGLATTGGLVSSTGVRGFRLGGGIGPLMSKHGLACDDGLVDATVAENAGFVWGLRGGGGSFGIVTQFELQLRSRRAERLCRPDPLPAVGSASDMYQRDGGRLRLDGAPRTPRRRNRSAKESSR